MRGPPLLLVTLCVAGCSAQPTAPAPSPAPSASEVAPPASAAEVAAPELPTDPVLAPAALFVDGAEQVFPRRARLASSPQLRWSRAPKAAVVYRQGGGFSKDEQIVAEAGPKWVRLLVGTTSVRVAMYAAATELEELVAEEVLVRPKNGTWKDASIRLFPGASVAWKEQRLSGERGKERFFAVEGSARYEGWLPEGTAGRVYRPKSNGPTPTHTLEGVSQLLDAPNGVVVAKLDGVNTWMVEVLGAARDGHQKVALGADRARLEGWVPTKKLAAVGGILGLGGIGTFGHGVGGWGGPASTIKLDRGTPLFASASGEQVGVLLEDKTVRDHQQSQEGRGRVFVGLGVWGSLDAWAPDAAFEAARRRELAEARRVRRVELGAAKITPGYQDPKNPLAVTKKEVGACAEEAEKGKKPLAGKFVLKLKLAADGKTSGADASGPLAKDATFKACVEKLRPTFWVQPDAKPTAGELEVTVTVAKGD